MPSLSLGTVRSFDTAGGRAALRIDVPDRGLEDVEARVVTSLLVPVAGAEVLVGWLDDEATRPVVLGGLHTAASLAAAPTTDDVSLTRGGPGVRVEDASGNVLAMEADGLRATSPSSIALEAAEAATVSGRTGAALNASAGTAAVRGLSLEAHADADCSVRGDMTLSLEGGSNATLKAAMVEIN